MADFYFGNVQTGAVARPAPETGMDGSSMGLSDYMEFSNGGAYVANSEATHRRFDMSWGATAHSKMKWLTEFRNGVYGNGLLYMIDPFADNALPPHWARPELATRGWPSHMGVENAPERIPVTASGVMPRFAARYTIYNVNTVPSRVLTLLIPPNGDLRFGFSGTTFNGGVMRYRTISAATGAVSAPTTITLLSYTGTTRTNVTLSGATYKAVQIYLDSDLPGASLLALISGTAVYRINNVGPTLPTIHTEGEGHTGLMFDGNPTKTYIMSSGGRQIVSAAASFIEVGAWL